MAELSCDDVPYWPKVFTPSQSALAVVRLVGAQHQSEDGLLTGAKVELPFFLTVSSHSRPVPS